MFYTHINTKNKTLDKELFNRISKELETTNKIDDAKGAIVIGGDGTILTFLQNYTNSKQLPKIYAFNYGHVGYLLPFNKNELESIIEMIKSNKKFKSHIRKRLEIKNHGNFLNEALITRKLPGKLNSYDIYIDDVLFRTVRCDSVLVTTNSGSSGYNLSAGGPYVDNSCDCIVLTFVSPFRLHYNSHVLNINRRVKIVVASDYCCVVDGFHSFDVHSCVEISYTGSNLDFAFLPSESSYEKLLFDKIFPR
ncbi:hypothetical protein EDEG_01388 [Edhazardia aedis USNM 41457]|uniref:NAD+ kinase n=1 Tax=Edhazardia aedis (strain USNM 41457) TaxID=1003232 RepID=J8ZXG1_EDHAE|nr:hypothetical protein EDEG_01388 [Edhazardia aedis USNM 41457]|eukprot:EJW04373.1 hypothetical protein EDEG_01388 [Edhazardia aedis USNM 41457]